MPLDLGQDWEVVSIPKKPHTHKLPNPSNKGIGIRTVIMCTGCGQGFMLVEEWEGVPATRGWRKVNCTENGWR